MIMYIVIYILKTNPDPGPSSLAQHTLIDNNKHEKEMIERFLNVIASQRLKYVAIQAHMGYAVHMYIFLQILHL